MNKITQVFSIHIISYQGSQREKFDVLELTLIILQ